jgi:anti-sigma-K factor RskA
VGVVVVLWCGEGGWEVAVVAVAVAAAVVGYVALVEVIALWCAPILPAGVEQVDWEGVL